MKIVAFFFSNNSALTPAARMSPNREANTVANVTVKPSVVGVPTCSSTTDAKSTRECVRGRELFRVRGGAKLSNTEADRGVVSAIKDDDKAGTPSAATVLANRTHFSTNQTKGEIMNKIMVSLFAVMLAAFAMSAVMRERVKADAECRMMEVAR